MKILIKFPTKGRKNKFFTTLDTYYKMSNNTDSIHFLVTLDTNDEQMNSDEVRDKLSEYKNLQFFFGQSFSKINAINRDLEKVNFDWDILLLASDDMIPEIKGYDETIIESMKLYFPDTDGVLWFNDGYAGNKLNTLCILGKKYFERFNYIYYPEYKSVWADNEFTDVSICLKKYKYFGNVIIRHQHPDWGFGERDLVHILNNSNGGHDSQLYNFRKINKFFIK